MSPKAVFIDGTHIKASANTKKAVTAQIPVASKHYAKELMEEVNADRDGYREYKSDAKICANCPTRELCTRSKDCVKTVQRHIC